MYQFMMIIKTMSHCHENSSLLRDCIVHFISLFVYNGTDKSEIGFSLRISGLVYILTFENLFNMIKLTFLG